MYDIAIIGAGATGVSLLKHVENIVYGNNKCAVKICLIDSPQHFARGKAFGSAKLYHQVNTPINMLALNKYEINSYPKFIDKSLCDGTLFPPRTNFSDYLSQTVEDIKTRKIIELTEIRHECTDIDFKTHYIISSGTRHITAKEVVLCIGAISASLFPQFEKINNFRTDFDALDDIINAHVIIAGTGLTAIDIFRQTYRNNNKIFMYSRNGLLPTCITKQNKYAPQYVDWPYIQSTFPNGISAEEFWTLFIRENKLLSDKSEYTQAIKILKKETPKNFFTYLQKRSMAGDTPFQDTLVSTRPYMHRLWRSFPYEERCWFLKNKAARWAAWRHPIPYEVIEELKDALNAQALEFHKASNPPRYDDNNFKIETHNGQQISAKYFIDGTGGTIHLSQQKDILIKNILKRGLIKPHPCGGIDIDPLTYNCFNNHKTTETIFSISPFNKGAIFSTNAFWFNARCAYLWARNWYSRNHLGKYQ